MSTAFSLVDLFARAGELTTSLEPAGIAAKGAVILAAGAIGSVLLRAASAALRHLVLALALAGSVAVALFDMLLPSWRVPLLPARAARPAVVALPASPAAESRATTVVVLPPRLTSAAISPVSPRPARAARAPLISTIDRGLGRRTRASTAPVAAVVAPVAAAAPVAIIVDDDLAAAATTGERPSIEALLLALWLTGATLVLIPIAGGRLRLAWLARSARPLESRCWLGLSAQVLAESGIRRRVRFLETDGATMPMTWGVLRPVVLLPTGAAGWTEARRRDVLRHELAHVRRQDCLTQLVAQIACALHWFNPLAWVAARRLRVEREHACDDQVLAAGARASEYAECLLDVARTMRPTTQTALAALAMARRAQLSERLFAVLDDHRRRERVSLRGAAAAVGLALGFIVPLAAFTPAARVAEAAPVAAVMPAPAVFPASAIEVPRAAAEPARQASTPPARATLQLDADRVRAVAEALLQPPPQCEQGRRGSNTNWTNSDGNGRRWTVRWSRGDCSYEVDARGEITFNRDATDIATISAGGYFDIEQRVGDQTRRLRIRPRGDDLERTYWVDGDQRPYDDRAREWLATSLVELDRKTGFAVEQRLPVLLERGGVDGALEEIDKMESDYARRLYYQKLIALRRLDSRQVERIVDQAGRSINSDFELAELLITAAKLDGFDSRSHKAFVSAVGTIDSDFEQRRALTALLSRESLAKDVVAGLLQTATKIDSDFELAELLISVSKQYAIDDDTRPMYIEAVKSIQSDFEHRRVLTAIVSGGGLTANTTKALLEDAKRINSDFELAEFLIMMGKKGVMDETNAREYFSAVTSIQSDFEHRRALTPLLQRDRLSKELVRSILQSARNIDSDFECASLLIDLAKAFPIDGDLRDDYLKAADTIGGEFEYGRAMSAIRVRGRA